MVAQVPVSHKPDTQALARAFGRARAERLVCFRTAPRVWACKEYTIVEVGEGSHDVACNCIAGQRGMVCKHAACVVFCRKHRVSPVRPAAPAQTKSAHELLMECYA